MECLSQGHNTAEVGFEPRPLPSESDTLPLSHRAPPVSYENNHHNYHKISKVYFELNTRAIGWSAKELASIALCIRENTENLTFTIITMVGLVENFIENMGHSQKMEKLLSKVIHNISNKLEKKTNKQK